MERIFQLIGNANVLRLGGTIQPSTETRGKQFYKNLLPLSFIRVYLRHDLFKIHSPLGFLNTCVKSVSLPFDVAEKMVPVFFADIYARPRPDLGRRESVINSFM